MCGFLLGNPVKGSSVQLMHAELNLSIKTSLYMEHLIHVYKKDLVFTSW